MLVRLVVVAFLAAPVAAAPDPLVEDYATHATGSFTSAAQAAADPAYEEVEAEVARLWPERADGAWLYQEQAILRRGADRQAAKAAPYFQRVGHVVRLPDGRVRRDNYVLKDPRRFVGFGRPGYAGPPITPDDLGEAGCHNILERAAPGFWTSRTEECLNAHRGAVRMTSLGILAGDRFANWDRGFGADGAQVWGPRAGGYVFIRTSAR